MKAFNRLVGAESFFVAFLLSGCVVLEPMSGSPDFSGPPRPRIDRPVPARPALAPGDVLAGLFEGETVPRVCFRPEKWREVLSYLIELEAYGRSESLRLEAHVEKIGNQMKEMNRVLKDK